MSNSKNNWVKRYAKRYFIDALGAMAKGLFATLLIGTIFGAVATLLSLPIQDIAAAENASELAANAGR